MLKTLLAFVFLLLPNSGFAKSAVPIVPTKTLRVIYYPFPPDIIVTKNGLRGSTYDIWERVAKKAHVKLEWIGPIPYLRALKMLEDGEVDAIYRLVKTPAREKLFTFTDRAPFVAGTGIVVLKSDPLNKITSEADINGKKIGWLRGGTLPPFLEHNQDHVILDSLTDNSPTLNMHKLFLKRLWGVFFIFSHTGLYHAAKEHQLSNIKILSFPGSDAQSQMHPAFSRKAPPDLVEKIKKGFNEDPAPADFEKLSQKYIDLVQQGKLQE